MNNYNFSFKPYLCKPAVLVNLVKLLVFGWLLAGCSAIVGKQDPAPVYKDGGSARQSSSKNKTTKAEQKAQITVVQEPVILQQRELSTPAKPKSSNVVVALLAEADDSYKQGNLNESVATIERALRIEPRNALLLFKLASLRLQQGQPGLAENLAKKSGLLAEGNAYLKKQNWLLIAEAREQMSDHAGAEAARKKANQY